MPRRTEIDLDKIESYAALGLTREQVCNNLGFTSRTWQNHNKDGSLEEAYLRGKAKGITEIANALFKKAQEGNTTAQIFFLKCNGWKEESSVEVKNTSPVQLVIKNDLKE